MNKWELKQMLEELRTDNTRHTETINKQITHIQALWDEIEFCTEHILNKSTNN